MKESEQTHTVWRQTSPRPQIPFLEYFDAVIAFLAVRCRRRCGRFAHTGPFPRGNLADARFTSLPTPSK
jgi:hypothetical protein